MATQVYPRELKAVISLAISRAQHIKTVKPRCNNNSIGNRFANISSDMHDGTAVNLRVVPLLVEFWFLP